MLGNKVLGIIIAIELLALAVVARSCVVSRKSS